MAYASTLLFGALTLFAAPALAAQAAADRPQPGPPETGTMYNGNNLHPPELKLQSPTAAYLEAMQQDRTRSDQEQGAGAGATRGGGSASGRAGGGN